MTRLLTTILTAFALVAFAGSAQANHHESAEDHGSHVHQGDGGEHAECTHAADEPCPKAHGKTCERHAASEPCSCAGHDHGAKKSETDA